MWNHLGPLTVVALDRTIFEHHPILLHRFTTDYGLIPFKIYHSWFQGEGFENVLSEFWSNGYYRRSFAALINFKNKLQGLKGAIKGLVNARRSRIEVIDSLSAELRNLDLNIDVGQDGDENSNFFGTLSKKRKQLTVRSIKSNGLLVSQHQLLILESKMSLEEIKDVVWDCGNDKSLHPNGSTFGFIKSYWKLIKNDIFAVVIDFLNKCDISIGCNASFITLIPKTESPLVILDDPMILNEVVHTLKMNKKKVMIFKLDIAKAYDTLSWDYLISVIKFMGFGNKCMRWKACLESARSSILVNGSPTMEFQLERELRQRNPLAPFLFILTTDDAIEAKKFSGINIGDLCLSHLIYADDVIVLRE
ncbi:RNA-directed DNA polymerase, eukaryota [Tanacetum coccineum]